MLEELSKHYELALYSSGRKAYVERIAQLIDPQQKYFSHILSREYTLLDPKTRMLKKHLGLFDRNEANKIIIDNRESGIEDIDNLLPIPDFDPEYPDSMLLSLSKYLLSIVDGEDVRNRIIRDFFLNDGKKSSARYQIRK